MSGSLERQCFVYEPLTEQTYMWAKDKRLHKNDHACMYMYSQEYTKNMGVLNAAPPQSKCISYMPL